jgi:hypothetical protein
MTDTKKAGVALSKIATELKIDPKVARAKLRRAKVPAGMTVGDTWMLTPKGVMWAKALLRGEKPKATATAA